MKMFFNWLRKVLGINQLTNTLEVLSSRINDLEYYLKRQPDPKLYVTLMVSGLSPDGMPIVFGESNWLERDSVTCDIDILMPIQKGATICVLADLSKVVIRGIFVGTELQGGYSNPIATVIRDIPVGYKVRAIVQRT
jgi:hypothetical protein